MTSGLTFEELTTRMHTSRSSVLERESTRFAACLQICSALAFSAAEIPGFCAIACSHAACTEDGVTDVFDFVVLDGVVEPVEVLEVPGVEPPVNG